MQELRDPSQGEVERYTCLIYSSGLSVIPHLFVSTVRRPHAGARPHRFFPPSDSTDTKAAGGGGTTTSNSAVRLALIGHSAGGWVARVYLSTAEYDGQVRYKLTDSMGFLGHDVWFI